jgi:DNA (cytosine-5)-methyltransferase 1
VKFGSVCSGIEAASVAFGPLGWHASWFSEIEPFPCAVLAHHYPSVPNHGDMTTLVRRILQGDVESPDMLCGGTPCQAFSVAGKRESLDDARGNLTLTFCEIANAIDHVRVARGDDECIVLWENVPGVLSTRDNAFGCFLGALAGSGCELFPAGWESGEPIRWPDAGCVYGPQRAIAWRVLDAQYFGLAQRRRRVFVVASARNGFDPAAVLFESDGVRRDSAPRREAREVAPTLPARSSAGGGLGTDFDCDGGVVRWPADVACTLNASFGDKQGLEDQHVNGGGRCSSLPPVSMCLNAGAMGRLDAESETLIPTFGGGFDVAHTLKAEGFDASEDGTGRGTPIVPVVFQTRGSNLDVGDIAGTIGTNADRASGSAPMVAFHPTQDPISSEDGTTHCMGTGSSQGNATIAVAFAQNQRDEVRTMEVVGALASEPGAKQQTYAMQGMAVRRLMPEECEPLQGFARGYTRIPWRGKSAEQCPDGPRYKALGNSWAVPCVRWIGQRIDAALRSRRAAA